MSLIEHARAELQLNGLFDKDGDYHGMLAQSVMELIEVFSKQGHSGYSASMVSDLFNQLSRYEPISPLTGNEDEWTEVIDGMYQNKRNSAVFKDSKSEKAHYIDAIVWETPNGLTYNAWVDGISSCQYIKSFPFVAKTFIISVDEEVKKDDWMLHIKDPNNLNVVWEYYDRRN